MKYKKKTHKRKTARRTTQKKRTALRKTQKRRIVKKTTKKRTTARRTTQRIRKRRTQGKKINKNKSRKFKQRGGSTWAKPSAPASRVTTWNCNAAGCVGVRNPAEAIACVSCGAPKPEKEEEVRGAKKHGLAAGRFPVSPGGGGSQEVELRSIPELDLLNQLINLFSGYDPSAIEFDLDVGDVAESLIGSFCMKPLKEIAFAAAATLQSQTDGKQSLPHRAIRAVILTRQLLQHQLQSVQERLVKIPSGEDRTVLEGKMGTLSEELEKLEISVAKAGGVGADRGGAKAAKATDGAREAGMKFLHEIARFLFQETISETEKTWRSEGKGSFLSELDKTNMEAKLRKDYSECYSQYEVDSVAEGIPPSPQLAAAEAMGMGARPEIEPEDAAVEPQAEAAAAEETPVQETASPQLSPAAGGGSAQPVEGAPNWDKIRRDLVRMFETVNLLSIPDLNSEIQRCVLRRMVRHYLNKRFDGIGKDDMKQLTINLMGEFKEKHEMERLHGEAREMVAKIPLSEFMSYIESIRPRDGLDATGRPIIADLRNFIRAIIFISLQLPGEKVCMPFDTFFRSGIHTYTAWGGEDGRTVGDLIYQPTLMKSAPTAEEMAEAREPGISEEKLRLNRMEIYVDHVLTNKHPNTIEGACEAWLGRDWHMGTGAAVAGGLHPGGALVAAAGAQVAAAEARDPTVCMAHMESYTMIPENAICVSILPFFSEEYYVHKKVAKWAPSVSDTQNLPQIYKRAARSLCDQFNVAMNAIRESHEFPDKLGVTQEGDEENGILNSELKDGERNRQIIMEMLQNDIVDITQILENIQLSPEINGLKKNVLSLPESRKDVKPTRGRKVLFVVSHGAFMENLWKTVTGSRNSPTINNLDIILLYNPGGLGSIGATEVKCELFTFPSYFKLSEKLDEIMRNPGNKIYIVMRHCPACHNVKGITTWKSAFAEKFNTDITSGPLSFCLGITPHWFICADLDPIFETCRDNGRKIVFAGSIIFRSLLTCCMVVQRYRIYNNNHPETLPQTDETSTGDAVEPEPEPES